MMEAVFRAELQALAKKHGLSFDFQSSESGTYRALFKDTESASKTFSAYARSLGGDPTWYGKRIVLNGKVFTVTGVRPNRPKNSFEITSHRGKVYITDASTIRRSLMA